MISPAEIVSLYGYGLGPTPALGAQVTNEVVANSLNGYQVLFNGLPAPRLYVGPNQVNCIVPAGVFAQDSVAVQIVTPQGQLPGPNLVVAQSQPEVFHDSQGFALAVNQDGNINSAGNPAAFSMPATHLARSSV